MSGKAKRLDKHESRIGRILRAEEFGVVVAIVGVVIVAISLTPNFAVGSNINTILQQISYVAICAAGMSLVVICGEIDLSIGSIYGFVVCQRCRVWGIRRCVRYRGVPIPTDKDAFSVIFSSSTYRPNVFMRVLDQGGISGVYVDTENMESVECRSGERDVDQVVLNV